MLADAGRQRKFSVVERRRPYCGGPAGCIRTRRREQKARREPMAGSNCRIRRSFRHRCDLAPSISGDLHGTRHPSTSSTTPTPSLLIYQRRGEPDAAQHRFIWDLGLEPPGSGYIKGPPPAVATQNERIGTTGGPEKQRPARGGHALVKRGSRPGKLATLITRPRGRTAACHRPHPAVDSGHKLAIAIRRCSYVARRVSVCRSARLEADMSSLTQLRPRSHSSCSINPHYPWHLVPASLIGPMELLHVAGPLFVSLFAEAPSRNGKPGAACAVRSSPTEDPDDMLVKLCPLEHRCLRYSTHRITLARLNWLGTVPLQCREHIQLRAT
ncbi:hypothetical protein BCR34DRAFT_202362 [Clohesyomyces aquaticus]|uniref:Uncharacterized protein n=1 Tax=Clohesyomyces aquaticus TaxID=1231657 RepID=A0A1Y1ZXH2_9PLEO|nr:hypothetical protein BCR34DRAFT_202362 [Clohesyomyces aquaticus]